MQVTESELKRRVQALIDGVPAAREASQQQNPPYTAWLFQVAQLVAVLGPQRAVYERELERLRNPDTYRAQIDDLVLRTEQAELRLPGTYVPATAVYVFIVDGIHGLLTGLLQAIDDGLLRTIEDRVASEIYSDLLSEAEGMLRSNQLRCAAGVCRVALENALRRLATRYGMTDGSDKNVNALNTWLYSDGHVYPQATFHQVESWAAIGNAFSHEENPSYVHSDVARMIAGVRDFAAMWGL